MLVTNALIRGTRSGALSDIEITDGVISGIGPAGSIAPGDHEVIDLDGRVVMPGLWDEHVHFSLWALHRRRFSLSHATSAAEAANILAANIAEAKSRGALDEVVVGTGYRDGLWPDEKTTALLDAVTGDQPVVLMSVDVHSCWVNTATLTKFGVTGHDRDGVLREQECFELTGRLSDVDDATMDGWALDAAKAAATRGVVGVVDLEMRYNPDDWRRRVAQHGHPYPIRVDTGVYLEYLERAISEGLRSGMELAPQIVMGPFKIITDGSLNTRTAHVCDPYLGVEGDQRGAMNYPLDQLEQVLVRASSSGLSLAVHAIGDQANAIILDMMERHGLSGRIEHAQLVKREDFSRFGRLGIVASVQPEQAVDDRDVTDSYWADRVDRAFALKTLQESGARLIMGSDAPVAPLDPWVTIAAAVTRTRDGRESWQPQECISLDDAIRASVRNSIEVGQPADLIALDADPDWLNRALSADAPTLSDALREMTVALTVVAGHQTHHAL